MSQTPSIMQYLVDLIASSRLKQAQENGKKAEIDLAESRYRNLSEKEVTFSKPVRVGNKWQVSITSAKRNFKIEKVAYNTGTLSALTKAVAQGIAKKASLVNISVPGLYYVDETDQLYLVLEDESNIHDGLGLTGYTFPPENFRVDIKTDRDNEFGSDGHIDIDHSVVAGRFQLFYIKRQQKPESTTNDDDQKTGDVVEKKEDVQNNENQSQTQSQQPENKLGQLVAKEEQILDQKEDTTNQTQEGQESQQTSDQSDDQQKATEETSGDNTAQKKRK